MDKPSQHRIDELTRERVAVVPYDPSWPVRYAEEEAFLHGVLPSDVLLLISHIGSTAVPGCSAKPIIDVQVEVRSLDRVKRECVHLLEAHGYEFIWRPTIGEAAPFYAWFIKRDAAGHRTHHIHMVEPDRASEDRILFRDFLRAHPEEVARYEKLKHELSAAHAHDRVAYTRGKSDYIASVVANARSQRP